MCEEGLDDEEYVAAVLMAGRVGTLWSNSEAFENKADNQRNFEGDRRGAEETQRQGYRRMTDEVRQGIPRASRVPRVGIETGI